MLHHRLRAVQQPSAAGIELIGVAGATAASITLPAHQAGDLLIILAVRTVSSTPPSLPSGWTTLYTQGSLLSSVRVGYRIATASDTASGSWFNATGVIAHVFRNAVFEFGTDTLKIGGTSADSSTATHVAITPASGRRAKVLRFIGSRDNPTSLDSAPSGYSLLHLQGIFAVSFLSDADISGTDGPHTTTLKLYAVRHHASAVVIYED